MTAEEYESCAHELRDRILALISDHPEIMRMNSAFKLHRLDDFECEDLNPSLAQAGWALSAAKTMWRDEQL